jgi:hypothetical protein
MRFWGPQGMDRSARQAILVIAARRETPHYHALLSPVFPVMSHGPLPAMAGRPSRGALGAMLTIRNFTDGQHRPRGPGEASDAP